MSDVTRIVGSIKQAALDAVEASKPAGVFFGTVASASPLSIVTEQRLTLGAAQLVLTRGVTNHTVTMTVSHQTETANGPDAHAHDYAGAKSFLVHGALQQGEKVILLQMQGGQRYIVLDRVVST